VCVFHLSTAHALRPTIKCCFYGSTEHRMRKACQSNVAPGPLLKNAMLNVTDNTRPSSDVEFIKYRSNAVTMFLYPVLVLKRMPSNL
jgi:hypothetical protein